MIKNFEEFKKDYPNIEYWEKSLNTKEKSPASYKSKQHKNKALDLDSKKIFFSKNDYSDIQYWRLEMIDLSSKLIGKEISGNCMEIGSGKGIATAYLSTKENVNNIISLDYSLSSLDTLQPKAHYQFKSANPIKIQRVYGSYNNIKAKNLSFIFAFGALHNSTDLEKTFQQLYGSLSEGGFLVSSDMTENFSTNIQEENYLTDRINKQSFKDYGKQCTYRETNDYFRSSIDYLYHAKASGFRVYCFFFDVNAKKYKLNSLNSCYEKGNGINSFYPKKARGRFDNTLLICVKDSSINNENINKVSQKNNNLNYNLWRIKNKVKKVLKVIR